MVIHVGTACFGRSLSAKSSIPRQCGPRGLQFSGFSATYAYMVRPRTTKLDVVTQMGRGCFTRSATPLHLHKIVERALSASAEFLVLELTRWSYMTCKVSVKSSPPTKQHPAFNRPDALPVAQPTASKLWGKRPQKGRLKFLPSYHLT